MQSFSLTFDDDNLPPLCDIQLRSASAYVHHLRDDPEDKLRVGRDDDLAARWVKEACQEGGLPYDEVIELHNPTGVLAVRRR